MKIEEDTNVRKVLFQTERAGGHDKRPADLQLTFLDFVHHQFLLGKHEICGLIRFGGFTACKAQITNKPTLSEEADVRFVELGMDIDRETFKKPVLNLLGTLTNSQ